jgi:hypothetical protein
MSAAMMRRFGPLALFALQGLGCGEARLLDSLTEGQTRIRLAPSEFVGDVVCQKGTPGALQTYAVQFQEITGDVATDAGLTPIFASGAVPCDQAVLIPSVAGRYYAAELRGFDRVVSDAEAATLPGRWTASCGQGGAALDAGLDPYRSTLSLRGLTVPMRGCTSFLDGAPVSNTSQIVVDQLSALGMLRCGQAAGEVATLQASLNGVTRTAPCGDPLVFDVTGAERFHTLTLTGFGLEGDAGAPGDAAAIPAPPSTLGDAGGPPDASVSAPVPPVEPGDAGSTPAVPIVGVARWRTQCVGRSQPGVAAPAYCDPLQPLP